MGVINIGELRAKSEKEHSITMPARLAAAGLGSCATCKYYSVSSPDMKCIVNPNQTRTILGRGADLGEKIYVRIGNYNGVTDQCPDLPLIQDAIKASPNVENASVPINITARQTPSAPEPAPESQA